MRLIIGNLLITKCKTTNSYETITSDSHEYNIINSKRQKISFVFFLSIYFPLWMDYSRHANKYNWSGMKGNLYSIFAFLELGTISRLLSTTKAIIKNYRTRQTKLLKLINNYDFSFTK